MIHTSLQELLKAMKGLVVLSQALEEMSKSLFNNAVPVMWSKVVCLDFDLFEKF
jgi:dynein heavy chain